MSTTPCAIEERYVAELRFILHQNGAKGIQFSRCTLFLDFGWEQVKVNYKHTEDQQPHLHREPKVKTLSELYQETQEPPDLIYGTKRQRFRFWSGRFLRRLVNEKEYAKEVEKWLIERGCRIEKIIPKHGYSDGTPSLVVLYYHTRPLLPPLPPDHARHH